MIVYLAGKDERESDGWEKKNCGSGSGIPKLKLNPDKEFRMVGYGSGFTLIHNSKSAASNCFQYQWTKIIVRDKNHNIQYCERKKLRAVSS